MEHERVILKMELKNALHIEDYFSEHSGFKVTLNVWAYCFLNVIMQNDRKLIIEMPALRNSREAQ